MKLRFRFSIIALAVITAFSPLFAAQKSVTLKIFPEDYALSIDGVQVKPQKVTQYLKKINIATGDHEFFLSSAGYIDKKIKININT